MRSWMLFLALLIPVLVLASETATDQKVRTYPFNFYWPDSSRYANGDSGDAVAMYPSELSDTTGSRVDLTWYGGPSQAWTVTSTTLDSTEVWDFYVRPSGGAWAPVALMQNRPIDIGKASEGYIADSRAFSSGVLSAALLADGGFSARSDDSTAVVDTDYVKAIYLWARSVLVAQIGSDTTAYSDALFLLDDTGLHLRTIPADLDTAYTSAGLLVGGEAFIDTVRTPGVATTFPDSVILEGNVRITGDVYGTIINATSTINSTSVLGTSQFDGSLQIGNDLIVVDDATVTGGLTASTTADVADSMQAGSSFGSMGFSADSTSAALVLGGWLVVDEVHVGAATITSGNTSVTYNMPGARPWDTFVIPAFDGNATSTVGTNALFVWDIPSNGKITFTRGGTTGDLQIKFLVVKYR